MKRVVVSVPGKIHLMGEHAVVHGKPALLAAVNRRLRVTITPRSPAQKNNIPIEIVTSEAGDHVRRAVVFLLDRFGVASHEPFRVEIISDIPAGYHLGSSASVAAGLSGAMMYFFKKLWNPMRINELAYEIEKFQHGTPSGGDNTTVVTGGFVWFRKETEFLKSIWQLPFRLPSALDHFFLVDTGRPAESTGEMVAFVRTRAHHDPDRMRRVFDTNEMNVKLVATAVKTSDEQSLIQALRAGEQTLEDMGVVSSTVLPMIRSIEQSGGAAKILGGGGRKQGVGYVLAYHRSGNTLRDVCKQSGFTAEEIQLGEEGIRLEEHT